MINHHRLNTRLVKDTFIYTVTDALGKALSFILLPLVSFYLSPDGLGLATNFSVLTSIVTLLAGLAIVNSLPYFFYEQTKEETKKLVSNIFLFSLFVCIVMFGVILISHNVIYQYIQIGLKYQVIVVFFVLLSIIVNMDMQLFRLEEKPKSFAVFQIIQILLQSSLVILFVIALRYGGEGKINAEVITMFVMGGFHLYLISKRGYFSLRYDKPCMRKLLKFGIPLMPHSLSFWLKGGMDKIFLTSFCGLYFNGIYSMAMSLASIYTLISNAFFNAYTPYLQKTLVGITPENESAEKRKIVKSIYALIGLFLVLGIFAVFCSWIIVNYLVDKKYLPTFEFLPGIILSLYIYAIYNFTIQFIYKMKKTFVLGIITFTGSLVQMFFSYMFIKSFGAIGVVYSSIIGSAIISVAISCYSYKIYPLPWLSFIRNKQ